MSSYDRQRFRIHSGDLSVIDDQAGVAARRRPTPRSLVRQRWIVGFLSAAFFTCLSVVTARVAIYLPFTPVPITLQVLAMVLAGLVLGPRLGALSQAQYLALGLAGAPVFASAAPGLGVLASPTAGYLFGFVAGSYATGLVVERWARQSWLGALGSGLAGIAAVYICGASWLCWWLVLTSSLPLQEGAQRAFVWGVVPFAPVDAAKAVLAAATWRGGRECLRSLWPFSS